MSVLATDNFNRANAANLGANWTVITNAISIVSNTAQTQGAQPHENYYNAVAWPADQYSQVVIGAEVHSISDKGFGPAVRIQAGGDLYLMQGNAVETRVYKRVSGTYTKLGSDGPSVAATDVLYLEAQGTTLVAKKNGTNICGSPITDSAIATGNAGLWSYSTAEKAANADDWEGGDFAGGAAQLQPWQLKGAMGAMVAS